MVDRPENLLQKAREAYKNHDIPKAKTYLMWHLKENPEDKEAQVFLDGLFKKDKKENKKLSIKERRESVRRLRLNGISARAIAVTLGVHQNTIFNDINVIREKNRKKLVAMESSMEIASATNFYDMLSTEAIMQFNTSEKKPTEKNLFLNTALRAKQAKIDLLMKTGYIPEAPSQLEIGSSNGPSVFNKKYAEHGIGKVLGNPVSRKRVLSMIELLIKSGEDPKIIDAEFSTATAKKDTNLEGGNTDG